MCRALGILVILLVTLPAFGQTQPVMTISFDDGFDGVGRDGAVAGAQEGNPELAPGRVGQALKSGPGTGYVNYPTAGIVGPQTGTVEMWVCPLDWTPDEKGFHVFFDVRGEGALYLYKYFESTSLLMLGCSDTRGPYYSSPSKLDWQPGQWHHIAGTWSPEGVLSYVDGQPAGKAPVGADLPQSLGETFLIGDHPWHIARTSSSLVDEVRIYDRALSPAHVAAHFAGNYDFVAPLSEETVSLTRRLNPDDGTLRATVRSQADLPDARLGVRFALVGHGEPAPADAPLAPVAAGLASADLKLPSLRPGAYDIVALVLLDGQQALELRDELIVPATDWRGSRLGLEDRVLPPWTPMELGGNTVRCWGREYTLGDSPLPERMTSAGEELLAAPVAITLRAGDQQVRLSAGTRTDGLSDTRTRVQSEGEVSGRLGDTDVRIKVKTTVEYDGLMLIELALPEGATLDADAASIEVPVRAERAIYRHRWARTWAGVTGNLPEGEGVVDHDAFIPYYWLGDNDRGLFWMCESDQFWPNGQSDGAIEIERAGDRVILRLNLLAPGQTLGDDWRFAFALQATPAKPIPADWRKWRLQPGRNGNVSIIWPTPQPDSLKYFGYPEAGNPEVFQQRVDKLHADGVKAVPYLCLSFLSAACPEWDFFGDDWGMGGMDTGSSDVAAYGAGFAIVSPVAKGYSDFIVSRDAQFVERYGIDGLYHDNTHPYSSTRAEAGLGYERDGKRYPTYPILGFRDLYRRMYAVMKSFPRDTFTMAHMSGKVTIPILAYDDSYLDGEHFRGRVEDSYMDMFSLDTFRAEFMGRQWGIMPFFLPEFSADRATQVEPTRGLMGLLMVHDVAVWPIWCNTEEANRALAALDEFGYVDASFVGYFDDPAPATSEMPDVYASAYVTGGRALLIVANLSREARSGAVTINPVALGLGAIAAHTWPGNEAIEVTDNAVQVSLEGLDWKMVLLTPQ